MSPVHSAYGKSGLASDAARAALCGAAVARSDWVALDAWEGQQHGHTRTLAVLRSLRQRLAQQLRLDEVRYACRSDSHALPHMWQDQARRDVVSPYTWCIRRNPWSLLH